MKAEIISIGTELLLGTITDTNASYLGQRLAALGIDCYNISQVGDNLGRLTENFTKALERSDLVITTGGLGPTQDDLTREAIAQVLGEKMTVDEGLERELRANFARRGAEMPASNLKQATLIASARAINNPVGTAPGWWVTRETESGPRQIVSMPGVPFEMKRMWEQEVEPRLQAMSGQVILSRTLKVLGYGESAAEARVQDLMGNANPTLAPYAKADGIHLRITAKSTDRAEALSMIAGLEQQVRARLGTAIYGIDEETPWGVTLALLEQENMGLVLLEAGGMSAGALAPMLSEPGTNRGANQVIGLVSVPELAHLAPLVGEKAGIAGEATGLKASLESLRKQTGAAVALGVLTDLQQSTEGQVGSALATSEIALVFENDSISSHGGRQTWRTAPGEVKRLVGLAACNMLRKVLLDLKGRTES